MIKINRLKKEAIDACKFRGHNMRRFVCNSKYVWSSWCKTCGKIVVINSKPMPNDIDIHGEAVALNCEVQNEDADCNSMP